MIRLLAALLVLLAAPALAVDPPAFNPGPPASSDTPDVMAWGIPNPNGPTAVSIRVGPDKQIMLPQGYIAAIVAAQHPDYLTAQARVASGLRALPRTTPPPTPAAPKGKTTPAAPPPKSRASPLAMR